MTENLVKISLFGVLTYRLYWCIIFEKSGNVKVLFIEICIDVKIFITSTVWCRRFLWKRKI